MGWLPWTRQAIYADYQADLRSRLGGALRTAVLFVVGLNTAFLLLDVWTQSDRLGLFVGIRLGWNALMLVTWWSASRIEPLLATRLACLVSGLALIALSGAAGGITSIYWPALMVLFLGMPVLLPLSASQAAGIAVSLSLAFAALPLATGETINFVSYIPPVFFVTAAAVECIASSAALDHMRFDDFVRRLEIERARDELQELDEQKSRFTANVHHELRTPLTLMLAPIEASLAGEFGQVSDLQRDYLRTAHANGLRLLKLINNLLDLAKIEGGRLEIRRRPGRLSRLITPLVESAKPMAERKRIELTAVGLESLPEVHVDPDAIEKVVVNLLGNALKFTDAGGAIRLMGEPTSEGGARIIVSDTGVGIPQDQILHVFDRFAQVDGSSTRRHEGTGIGLALVRELVELHAGRVWAESDGLGRGTRMVVELPPGEADVEFVEESDEASTGRDRNTLAALEVEISERNEEGLRVAEMERNVVRYEGALPEGEGGVPTGPYASADVLICEDNPDMRRLLAHFVGKEFRVRAVANGRAGLEALREKAPDLVLTDVMMPEMSGTELCRAIKSDPETHGIPVVLVTSKAEREMKIEGLELGADDYVTKPFHPRELMARVRGLVKLRRLQQELAVQNARLESTNAELQATLAELREATVQLAQAERLAAVGELAAGVAHEVNNPVNFAMNSLRTLRGYVEDVRSMTERVAALDLGDRAALERELRELGKLRASLHFDDLTETLGELVDIVTEGLERTHRLVGDLRDLAAPGSGRQPDVDLARGLETTLQLVKHAFQDAGVGLQVEVERPLPRLECDPSALNQVFLNLLKNAAEALEGHGGTVSVGACVSGDAVQVSVRDDGPGVAPELLPRIFEPFFSTKGAGKGAGLGLSISRRIANEHGGSLEVESSPGQGTTFTLTLPVRDADHAAQA
jgi:signal transduction histidine kinase